MDFVETDYFLDKKKLKNENKKSISLKDMFNEAIDFDSYEVEYKFDLPKENDLSEILFTTEQQVSQRELRLFIEIMLP